MEQFSSNLRRLLGVHALTAKEAAKLLGMSESAFSKWAQGDRQPSFQTALKVGDLFEVPADRLARADFGDLLANELADPERYARVEKELKRRRSRLAPVPSSKPTKVSQFSDKRQSKATGGR